MTDAALEAADLVTRKTTLARKLDEARRAAGLSHAEMARRMRTSRTQVYQLLGRNPVMTIDSVARAARTLGLDLELRLTPSPKT